MYSELALTLYALKKEHAIKSNAHFWREFNNDNKFNFLDIDIQKYEKELNDNGICLICIFDEKFPITPTNLKFSERPYIFAYKGNIKLLENITNNVAVVGVLTPTADIVEREQRIVDILVQKEFCIISGLANGCDTVAHKECLIQGGKTVAILPSTLENIYPNKNAELAEKIVQNGGLVITEYVTEPTNRYENIKRFIERDRLQAMFAGKIILIASYVQGEGDSGSRHAMAKAKEYGKERLVMFNRQTDKGVPIFGLNESLVSTGIKPLTPQMLSKL